MLGIVLPYMWITSVSRVALEKEMATHSSVLAWRIPVTGEPGGLPSMGSHRVEHDWSDLAAVAARVAAKDRAEGSEGEEREGKGRKNELFNVPGLSFLHFSKGILFLSAQFLTLVLPQRTIDDGDYGWWCILLRRGVERQKSRGCRKWRGGGDLRDQGEGWEGTFIQIKEESHADFREIIETSITG